jgi:hypothetical protein
MGDQAQLKESELCYPIELGGLIDPHPERHVPKLCPQEQSVIR